MSVFAAVLLLLSAVWLDTAAAEPVVPVHGIYHSALRQPFPDALNDLQLAIEDAGYRVVRIQRVDVGLRSAGYPTAPYRIVYFARKDIDRVVVNRPRLALFLPLSITLYADGATVHVLAISPLTSVAGAGPGLRKKTAQWDHDLRRILADVRTHEMVGAGL